MWCISVYIGWILGFIALGFKAEVFLYGLALSAVAIIIESVVGYLIINNEKILNQREAKK